MVHGLSVQLCIICSSYYEYVLFRAVFLLAIVGAFRSNELLARSRTDSSGCTLALRDIHIKGTKLHICLRRSKMDQRPHGANTVLHSGDQPCPVYYTGKYLVVWPKVNGPLFMHTDGICLSCFQFISVFRACLSALGFPNGEFGVHSFRIGAVTVMSKFVFFSERIMAIGHWCLWSYMLYVQPSKLHWCRVFAQFFQVHSKKSGWSGTASCMGLAFMHHLLDGTLTWALVTGCRTDGLQEGGWNGHHSYHLCGRRCYVGVHRMLSSSSWGETTCQRKKGLYCLEPLLHTYIS